MSSVSLSCHARIGAHGPVALRSSLTGGPPLKKPRLSCGPQRPVVDESAGLP